MDRMNGEDLELVNANSNTALFLATAVGNIETVKIMLEKNMALNIIPGAKGGATGQMMPLYTAALFGNHDVVKYLYDNSRKLCDSDGWDSMNRGWLLEKCVEADMFDVALKIVKAYPKLGSGAVLLNLARKPDAFSETKWGKIKRKINSALTLIGLKARGAYGNENEALQLLKIVWGDISKKGKKEIDNLLRGPPDSFDQDQGRNLDDVQALQVQKLIHEHCAKLKAQTKSIMEGTPNAIEQDQGSDSRNLDQAQQLRELISEHLVNVHVGTNNMFKHDKKKGDKVMRLNHLIFKNITNMHDKTQKTFKGTQMGDGALQLKNVIFQHIEKMCREIDRETMKMDERYSSRILFVAAEMGNTKFLVELIRQYPDLIWKVNDDNQSIFHIAVKNRHEDIYNLLYEIGSVKDLITPLRDQNENNMLHIVGKNAMKDRLADVSGPYLQMQRELLWFKEVRNMIPPTYRESKNKLGQTPYELFTEEHRELVLEGEKWMKGMASECMVVATLIATIVFAAAFTVPGGYNQNDGAPIFYKKVTFIVFVVADAISLFLSSASILTFLSLLTSRYAERDFMEPLPRRLMLGLVTLFLSITAMMVTFSVSFFVLYHQEMKWIPISIGVFAVMPVLLYVLLQHHLLLDVLRSSYGSKYLFKPQKQLLY